MKSDLVDIAAQLRHETVNAYLVYDGKQEVWLPKSQCEYDGKHIFTMPEWLAKTKGLI